MTIGSEGLDAGDNFFVNGVQVVTGASNTPVNYDQCFNNTSGAPITVNASLTANRKDETVQVIFTITAGTPGTGQPGGDFTQCRDFGDSTEHVTTLIAPTASGRRRFAAAA